MVERLSEDLIPASEEEKTFDVQISYDVIKLFSEQLYASPVKAIEELVVNGWDAEASVCSVLVDLDDERPLIAVFDDGHGMSAPELENLWHIGISDKERTASARKQIGKFGIGKLASYAVARRATYISKTTSGVFAVSINFEDFATATDADGQTRPIQLSVRRLSGPDALASSKPFASALRVLDVEGRRFDLDEVPSWTLVVLEDLKEKASNLQTRRLRWVLATAMPLAADFALYLDGELVSSSKEEYERIVEFAVGDLDESRLKDLSAVTGETWESLNGSLQAPSFPSGISGTVYVTEKSLYAKGGKSEDLGRSHGFFVRVHNRLINETDPLFGARPLSFSTFYRFAAIVEADDLNRYVTAARDDVEQSDLKRKLRELLIQLFNQARDRQQAAEEAKKPNKQGQQKESTKEHVDPNLVERPLADALLGRRFSDQADPDQYYTGWRMLEGADDLEALQAIIEQLYDADRSTRKYSFTSSSFGRLEPVGRLNVDTNTVVLNEDHELVREFGDDAQSRRLLESMVIAEVLLEVYLHEAAIEDEVIDEILNRRDSLMRGLARDESYSLRALAAALRDAADNADDLEIAVVGALRALGFNTKHIAGAGAPDGEAKYLVHGSGPVFFTLEAKSTSSVPTLNNLDFAGLHSHYRAQDAQGCLVVAPTYPGIDDESSEVSQRARQQGVSCWTVEQLATVVEAAERRHITAESIQRIVLRDFAPLDVAPALAGLLAPESYDTADLYGGVLQALVDLEPRMKSAPRDVSMIAAEITRHSAFETVEREEIYEALIDLAHSSRGMLHVDDDMRVFVLGSLDEVRRRVAHMTGGHVGPRRGGSFREAEAEPTEAGDSASE